MIFTKSIVSAYSLNTRKKIRAIKYALKYDVTLLHCVCPCIYAEIRNIEKMNDDSKIV